MSYREHAFPPLLTADEERTLAARIEAGRAARARIDDGCGAVGDEQLVEQADLATHRFVESNMGLVFHLVAGAKTPAHVEHDDVVQDAVIGLHTAVEKFDASKGFKFSTYATWWIRQAIQRGLENTASAVRIPAHRASELRVALAESDGDFDQLHPKLARVASLGRLVSLDGVTAESEAPLGATIAASDEPGVDVLRSEVRFEVRKLVSELPEPTRHAVVRRFGLDGRAEASYAEIASELGIGGEAVRRRVQRALEDLRSAALPLAA